MLSYLSIDGYLLSPLGLINSMIIIFHKYKYYLKLAAYIIIVNYS